MTTKKPAPKQPAKPSYEDLLAARERLEAAELLVLAAQRMMSRARGLNTIAHREPAVADAHIAMNNALAEREQARREFDDLRRAARG